MGLLRKKTSKPNLKKEQRAPTPPPQLPPLPGHIRRAEQDAAAAAAAQSQQLSAPTPKFMRRRSRSLWATSDEAKAALANARPVDSLESSGAGDLASSQPWRNASTWAALHGPARPPSILGTLINPCSPSQAAPGWRGKGGGGFFTSAAMDNEIAKRSDRTPGSAASATPRRTPMSPSRRTRAVVTPSPAISAQPRRLDFGGLSPDPNSDSSFSESFGEAFSSPIPVTPRSLRRRSASLSDLTPNAVVTGSSPATPGVLLTPTSTNLLPSLASRTPSPIARDSMASVSSGSSRPSPSRPLPRPPTDSDGELDSFHSAAEDDENGTEVIDFSRPTPKELAAAAASAPLRRDGDVPKRSSGSTIQSSTVSSGSVPASPRQQTMVPSPGKQFSALPPTASPSQNYSPAPTRSSPSQQQATLPVTIPSPSQRYSPVPANTPSPAQPVERVPPHAALAAPSSFTPSPPAPSAAFIQPRQVSAGSNASNGSQAHSQAHSQAPSQAPTRNGSSGSQGGSRSASSAGHNEVPPHTPDGIAHAINVWRRRSMRRDAPVPRRFSLNKEKPAPAEPAWQPTNDVFAPTGAWEAQGAYNPYDESAFTDEPDFTPPLRLPVVSKPPTQQRLPPRPAPRMNIMQMQARRPSGSGPKQLPPATRKTSSQWI